MKSLVLCNMPTDTQLVCCPYRVTVGDFLYEYTSPLIVLPNAKHSPLWYILIYWEYLISARVGRLNFGGGD